VVVVRFAWQTCPLVEPTTGTAVALPPWLATVRPGQPGDRAVGLGAGTGAGPTWRLVALALPEDAANAARRRLRRTAQRKGRTVSAQSALVAGFVLVLTSLPPDPWSAAAVLALYRVRWQAELAFKRLKGVWHLSPLAARTPRLAEATLLGRLLGALLAERLAYPHGHAPVAWFDHLARPVSLWRYTVLWREVVLDAITGRWALAAVRAALPLLQRHLCDTPRRRRQQAAGARQPLPSPPARLCQLPLFPEPTLAPTA
jgi:hypothetical protein